MRIRLDNGKSYDLPAMFIPKVVGFKSAYEALRLNYSSWPNALSIPLRHKTSLSGLIKWLIVIVLHSISLLTLPLLLCLGASMKSYTLFLSKDAQKMQQYKADLSRIYAKLASIEDKDEYQLRLKEEIAKVKPF